MESGRVFEWIGRPEQRKPETPYSTGHYMIEINFKGRRVRIRSSEARQLEYEEKYLFNW